MLRSDINKARLASEVLDATAGYNSANVAAFVITPRMATPQSGPPVQVVIKSTDAPFQNMLTAFTNAVNNKRTTAQAVLDSMGITG